MATRTNIKTREHDSALTSQRSAQAQRLQEERQQFQATNAQLVGQIAELRHQLATATAQGADRDKELADTANQLDVANAEREQLQVRAPTARALRRRSTLAPVKFGKPLLNNVVTFDRIQLEK